MPSVIGRHVDAADYERLYRATRGMRPEVRRAFRKRLREAATIGQRAARAKIRTMPATARYTAAGAGRHRRRANPVGLRSTLAINIRVEVSPRDVAVKQFTAGLRGRNARDLPRDIDSGGWRHPVYGHKPEVFQKGHPYFMSAMREKRPAMEREVSKVLDDIRAKVLAGRLHLG